MDAQTRVFTWLNGASVGTDVFGNVYYRSRRTAPGARERRWVVYANGGTDASAVPPEWYGWLHHTADAPIPDAKKLPWQKPFIPNETGTALSYRPPGHDYEGGTRPLTAGDYEAWTPAD
jgi:NADH:ubiquinone oxidoreductase subunit